MVPARSISTVTVPSALQALLVAAAADVRNDICMQPNAAEAASIITYHYMVL